MTDRLIPDSSILPRTLVVEGGRHTIAELTAQALALHDHENLVALCRKHITSNHAIWWGDWVVIGSPDKYDTEGTLIEKGGETQAAEWLARQIEGVLALTAL
jgi:hypothetical protein